MISKTGSTIAAVVDLFAGAGGLGVGAQSAGGEVRLSVELDPTACQTIRANLGEASPSHAVLEADVTSLRGMQLRQSAGLSKSDLLVVVGGAPCQPFSKAAYWTEAGDDAAYRRARAAGINGIVRPAAPTVPRADSRRNLVEYFARLVVQSKADAFVFENVPSILTLVTGRCLMPL